MLDFLWRSHLQYLEQLRQVIGLRSYGQKDPLAEFRREAFQLFETLLFKVKSDTLKLLMNLKVVVQEEERKESKIPLWQKNKRFLEMLPVHVAQVKNINIVMAK